jgi:hypothetical protein
MRRLAIAWIALGALGITACIIGPKQDDPAEVRESGDTGVLADDVALASDSAASDTGMATSISDTGPFGADAPATPGDAKADGDAGCGDGGYPITALRFDAAKKCWAESVFFECQAGPDGGTAFTCFVQISTGGIYLASTTQIPSGADYRLCKMGEGTSAGDRCK